MQYSNWADGEFVNAFVLNMSETLTQQSFALHHNSLHTPGVADNADNSFSSSGLILTSVMTGSVLFPTGILATGNGTTNGSGNPTYATNFASLVPGSGTVTVYLLASASTVGLNATEIVGPPAGHPDYDPTFAPFTLYAEMADTLVLTASLAPADNNVTFEIGRMSLSAGATTLPALDQTHIKFAGSMLSKSGEVTTADLATTGVAAGSYTSPDLTIGADGRITAAVSDSLLGKNNTWTGSNTYTAAPILNNAIPLGGKNSAGVAQQLLAMSGDNWVEVFSGSAATGFRALNFAGNSATFTVDDTGHATIESTLTLGTGGTSGNQAVVFSQFPHQFDISGQSATGYHQLPNGFVEIWGIGTVTGGVNFFNFAVAFPVECFSVMVEEWNPTSGTWQSGFPTLYAANSTPSSTAFICYGVSWTGTGGGWTFQSGGTFRYRAIGR